MRGEGILKALLAVKFWELSGRVPDRRPRSWGFEPHQRHCVVSLSKTNKSLLSTGSSQEDPPHT